VRLRRGLIASLLAVSVAGALTIGAGARKPPSHPYTASLTYTEGDHGTDSGGATRGITGSGKFSAKLGPGAAIAARLIGAATGVPLAKIAKGGSYKMRRDIDASGKVTAILVAKFKAPGLGSACLSFVSKPGRFNGGGFVPMTGTLKMVGGKGAAARWRGSAQFEQTAVSGGGTEQIKEKGTAHPSTGTAKGFTAACRKVASG
jgi:hypothetical protein